MNTSQNTVFMGVVLDGTYNLSICDLFLHITILLFNIHEMYILLHKIKGFVLGEMGNVLKYLQIKILF